MNKTNIRLAGNALITTLMLLTGVTVMLGALIPRVINQRTVSLDGDTRIEFRSKLRAIQEYVAEAVRNQQCLSNSLNIVECPSFDKWVSERSSLRTERLILGESSIASIRLGLPALEQASATEFVSNCNSASITCERWETEFSPPTSGALALILGTGSVGLSAVEDEFSKQVSNIKVSLQKPSATVYPVSGREIFLEVEVELTLRNERGLASRVFSKKPHSKLLFVVAPRELHHFSLVQYGDINLGHEWSSQVSIGVSTGTGLKVKPLARTASPAAKGIHFHSPIYVDGSVLLPDDAPLSDHQKIHTPVHFNNTVYINRSTTANNNGIFAVKYGGTTRDTPTNLSFRGQSFSGFSQGTFFENKSDEGLDYLFDPSKGNSSGGSEPSLGGVTSTSAETSTFIQECVERQRNLTDLDKSRGSIPLYSLKSENIDSNQAARVYRFTFGQSKYYFPAATPVFPPGPFTKNSFIPQELLNTEIVHVGSHPVKARFSSESQHLAEIGPIFYWDMDLRSIVYDSTAVPASSNYGRVQMKLAWGSIVEFYVKDTSDVEHILYTVEVLPVMMSNESGRLFRQPHLFDLKLSWPLGGVLKDATALTHLLTYYDVSSFGSGTSLDLNRTLHIYGSNIAMQKEGNSIKSSTPSLGGGWYTSQFSAYERRYPDQPTNINVGALDGACFPDDPTGSTPGNIEPASFDVSFLPNARFSWNFAHPSGVADADGIIHGTTQSLVLNSSNSERLRAGEVNPNRFLVYSIVETCTIEATAQVVAGFFTCKKLIIQTRDTPLDIVGTIIAGETEIHQNAVQAGVHFHSIHETSGIRLLEGAKILKPLRECVPDVGSTSSPLWSGASSFDDIQRFEQCSVASLFDRADPFRWTTVDPDCGILGSVATNSNVMCKFQTTRYNRINVFYEHNF